MKPVALMRYPAINYAGDYKDLGPWHGGPRIVDFQRALRQHRALQRIYRRHGYRVELLPPSRKYSASCYVQDTAFIVGEQALILNGMSAWRTKEARFGRRSVERVLGRYFYTQRLGLPALLDGGEIVETDTEYLVGRSLKAAHAAVDQIRAKMDLPKPLRTVTVPGHWDYIHLGTEMSYLGDGYLIASQQFSTLAPCKRYKTIVPPRGEENAGNCVRLFDGTIIAPEECVWTVNRLRSMGWDVETVDLSEYNKTSGSISCLSINFQP